MEKYISILRGINVSGKNIIKMTVLKEMYEELGHKNVITYIQSGNVIFENKKSNQVILAQQISNSINKTFRYEVPVQVLTKDELNFIYINNPFLKNNEITSLHVTVLKDDPDPELVKNLSEIKSGEDQFTINNNIVYLFCPNGYGKTKLTNSVIENKLKTSATTRNWKTISKLIELAN